MDHQEQEQIALHRWAVIAEAASHRLTAAERGAGPGRSPRALTLTPTGSHGGIPGHNRPVDPGTWRAGGLESLKPAPRADTGAVRAHPELFAEAAAPASISTRAGLSSAVR